MSGELPLSSEDVAEIVAILDRTPYDRIDIRSERFSLAVFRSGEGWVQAWEWPQGGADAAAVEVAVVDATGVAATAGAAPESPATAQPDATTEGIQTVQALLPGTFYRSPQPGAPPFIELGSTVAPDSVIGIIETMKLMTPVYAGVDGVVIAILVENASVVDAQAPLVQVKSAAA